MLFKIGDIANGVQTSEQFFEGFDYVSALEHLVAGANLYIEPIDEEAESCKIKIDEFIRECSRLGSWID